MKLALVVVLVLTACRIPISRWSGTPPRAGNAIRIALDPGGDVGAAVLARQVLTADPRVSLIAYERAPDTSYVLETGCAWGREHGVDYYVTTSYTAKDEKRTECVAWKGSLLDLLTLNPKGKEECSREVVRAEYSSSTFTMNVYDVFDCKLVPSLSQIVDEYVSGPTESARAEAAYRVSSSAPLTYRGFPDQVSLGADATPETAIENGQYALYRNREFRGILAAHGNGARLRMLRCCSEPTPGDVLVRRGDLRYFELLLSFDAGITALADKHYSALGAGIHLRRYNLAGGFQIGVSAETLGATDHRYALFSIEPGFGLRVAPAWHVSANLGLGAAFVAQDVGTESVDAWTLAAVPSLRALFQVSGWWYAGVDLAYILAPTIEDWHGGLAAGAYDVQIRGPLARAYLALAL